MADESERAQDQRQLSWRGLLYFMIALAAAWIGSSYLVHAVTGHGLAGLFAAPPATTLPLAAASAGLFIGGYALAALLGDRDKLADLVRPNPASSAVAGAAWGGLAMGAVFAIAFLLGDISAWTPGPSHRLGLDLIVVFVAALAEELIFRGVVFDYARRWLGEPLAIGASSLVFALAHVQNPGVGALAFMTIVFGGVALAIGFSITRSIWAPASAHFAWNALLGPLLGAPLSGHPLNTWMLPSLPKGLSAIGGDFGPENTPTAVIVSAVVAVLLLIILVRRKST